MKKILMLLMVFFALWHEVIGQELSNKVKLSKSESMLVAGFKSKSTSERLSIFKKIQSQILVSGPEKEFKKSGNDYLASNENDVLAILGTPSLKKNNIWEYNLNNSPDNNKVVVIFNSNHFVQVCTIK